MRLSPARPIAAPLIAASLKQFRRVNADKADFPVGSANRVTVDYRCAEGRVLILANEGGKGAFFEKGNETEQPYNDAQTREAIEPA